MANPYTLRSGSNGAHGPVNAALFLVVAEGVDGGGCDPEGPPVYEPINLASSLEEAREMCAEDMRARIARVEAEEAGADGCTLCPEAYAVWGRDAEGQWMRLEEVLP